MPTTVTLDERLIAHLERRAAEHGTSVSKLVEQAVRLFMRTPLTPTAPQAFEPMVRLPPPPGLARAGETPDAIVRRVG
jgi:hypothetical protein